MTGSAVERVTGEQLPSPTVSLDLLHATEPTELLNSASRMATPLAKLIEDKKLFVWVRDKKHVYCEGWTTLAAMCGMTPHEVETTEKDGVYVSVFELRRIVDGRTIGRASAECGASDEEWGSRQHYARRSMAQTRATSKVCRLVLSWIMVLAGYSATPAEEMPRGVILPGKAKSWGGYGGQPLTRVPDGILVKAMDWLKTRGAEKNATIIEEIETELESRREPGSQDPGDDGGYK